MNSNEKIEQLKREIANEERNISNCKHSFNEAIYDPEQISVQDDRAGYETHRVDRWPVPSYHKENKDRWSRKCSVCGFKQYTYTQEAVISKYQPKF